MAKSKVISRRRYPRRRFNQKVGVLYKGLYSVTGSVQIGEGGMMISSPEKYAEGDRLIVSFMVPRRDFIIERAQVQYIGFDEYQNTYQYGLKFLTITFDNRRILRDFISEKTEEEAIQEGAFGHR